jgi:hypothetical protein
MGPSERTFNQVKGILSKLDRSIDQLRAQRTQPPAPASSGVSSAVIAVDPPKANVASAVVQAVVQQAQAAPMAPRSPFGRATPLPPK